jgi:hypothetical protein
MNSLITPVRLLALGAAGSMLVFVILYLIKIQKTLNQCAPESRTISPGKVWLMLIPVFGYFYNFIIVLNMAKSLQAEFTRRGIVVDDETPGQKIGLAMAVCLCCGMLPGILGGLISTAAIVLWVMYWVKIASYSRMLESAPAS